jgi:hypothetical protein
MFHKDISRRHRSVSPAPPLSALLSVCSDFRDERLCLQFFSRAKIGLQVSLVALFIKSPWKYATDFRLLYIVIIINASLGCTHRIIFNYNFMVAHDPDFNSDLTIHELLFKCNWNDHVERVNK